MYNTYKNTFLLTKTAAINFTFRTSQSMLSRKGLIQMVVVGSVAMRSCAALTASKEPMPSKYAFTFG